MDPSSYDQFKSDPECQKFLGDAVAQKALENTHKLNEIVRKIHNGEVKFDAVFYPGGHGPMYDLANNKDVKSVTEKIYADGGLVSAVCHGTAALFNNPDIIKSKKITGFSNAEEDAVQLSRFMPFMLEDKVKELGGVYEKAGELWGEFVVVDGRVITGQNPASGTGVGKALKEALEK